MKKIKCFLIFCVILTKINGWSIGNLLLAGSQATLTHADTVAIGAQRGLNECSRQFSFERWSCPETIFADVFQNNLPANREIAFVQSIISAGIVYTITRNCSLGQLEDCKCMSRKNKREDTAKTGFLWGGCSDNTELGSRIAVTYLDEREMGHDFKAVVRLHNHEVGRQAVKETMIKTCKCHGVSGSCSLKTCWMRINEFQEVGNYLKRAYRKAVKIDNNYNSPVRQNDVLKKSMSSLPKSKLAFSEDSPDYCIANSTLGSNGTLGRYCSQRRAKDVTKEEKRSCRKLCTQCGHKVKRERRRIIMSCNCKFKFCCEVECQSCAKEHYNFVCSRSH